MQGGQRRGPINGLDPLIYTGGLPNLVVMERQPTPKDYQGFFLGHWWIVPQSSDGSSPTEQVWVLVSKRNNVAKWKRLHGSGGGSTGVGAINKLYITTLGAGTYTPPSDLIQAQVEVVGGGAGGCGLFEDGSNNTYTGPSGASGGYSSKLYTAAQLGSSQPYVVGAGGTAGTAQVPPQNAGNGGNTTFGTGSTLITGGGGQFNPATVLSTGGTASGGDINIDGQNGTYPIFIESGLFNAPTDFTYVYSYAGANSVYGLGGARSGVSSNPSSPTGYGAGGNSPGGTVYSTGSPNSNGTAGAQGIIIITEYLG